MKLNVATGIFQGFNDKEGIMLCGYEWGGSDEPELSDEASKIDLNMENTATFANKAKYYGEEANKWRYDQRIMTWFELWGHKLDRDNPGAFEQTLVQTNWCNTQAHRMVDENGKQLNYWNKLLADDQIENFIGHINCLKPRLLIFFGSEMIKILQHEKVLPRFKKIMGDITVPLEVKQERSFLGTKFKIGFQTFEKCNVISLPHPSSSRGLENEYISRFTADIGEKVQEVKQLKGIL